MSTTIGVEKASSNTNPFEIARYLTALVECSREMQEIVFEMAAIVSSDSYSEDEHIVAFDAMVEALFPGTTTDALDRYHEKLKSEEGLRAAAELKTEEKIFADRLRDLMAKKNVTQEQLATAAEIGQPAVSNILNRRCRPQTRTIERFAKALKVKPKELWPAIENESR